MADPPPRAEGFYATVDEATLAAARANCNRAAAVIYDRYAGACFNLAARMLGDTERAADCVQEAMLQAFRGLDSYRGEAPFGSWLRQIVLRCALAELRRRSTSSMDQGGSEPLATAGAVDPDVCLPIAATATLEAALERLPPICRSVLWLQLVEGLSHREIGQALGRSTSFSKSQSARGIARLRQLLRVHEEEVFHAA